MVQDALDKAAAGESRRQKDVIVKHLSSFIFFFSCFILLNEY